MPAPVTPPLSWQVLEALQTLLQRIRTANDYYTEAGANVLLEDAQLPDDQLPALLVTGVPDEPAVSQGRTVRFGAMDIQIEARIPAGRSDAQRTAHNVCADLLRAVPTRGADLPIGCSALSVESADIGQRADGQPYITVLVELRAGLVTTATPA